MTNNKSHENALNVEHSLKSSEAIITKYRNPILYGLAVIVIIIGGYFLYHHFVAIPHEKEAEELLFKGQQYFAIDQYDKALNGDKQGYPGFISIANDFSGTKSGNLAKLYAGLSYAQQNKYNEAVKYLEEFSQCKDAMISPAALGALGNCYAELNQLDKATETLEKAANLADNNSLSPIYLIQAGEIYESQGKNDKALACYEQIKKKYVNSMQYSDIDKYIERVSK